MRLVGKFGAYWQSQGKRVKDKEDIVKPGTRTFFERHVDYKHRENAKYELGIR